MRYRFLIFIFLLGCSSNSKKLDYNKETNLLAYKSYLESLVSSKDILLVEKAKFLPSCFKDWEQTIQNHSINLHKQRSLYYEISRCYSAANDFNLSLYYSDFYRGLKKTNKLKISNLDYDLGFFYFQKSNDDMAMAYLNESLNHNKNNIAAIYLNSLIAIKNYDVSLLEKSLSKLRRFNQRSKSYALLSIIQSLMIKNNSTARSYYKKNIKLFNKDERLFISYLIQGLTTRKKVDFRDEIEELELSHPLFSYFQDVLNI